jgi:aryl-alcohol dehydrogenase-like predicted oxidoreductase
MAEKRLLGNSGIAVSPVMLGGNVFGWTIDEKQSFAILDAFFAGGFNFIDTADVYSRWKAGNQGGESETIIGRWMKERQNRGQVILATKVGGDMGQGKRDLSAAYIRRAVEKSLRRLQTDYIDLYQSHYDDPATPVEETLDAYAQLVKQGKVRVIGASNYTPERLLQSLEASKQAGYPSYQTLQPLYNLYDRELFERELLPLCLEHSLGVISYFSLASGFLTGKYRSEKDLAKSARGGGNKTYLNERGFRILDALDTVADQFKSRAASVALAWLLTRPSLLAPIASATTLDQLKSLMDAASLTLDANSIGLLNNASEW